jgi:hypothetical protein
VSKKSKQVENRIQSSGHVITAAKTHRVQVAESLAARAIEVQGANTPATKEVFLWTVDFLVDALGHSVLTLDQGEMRVVAERADDVGLRDQRDSAMSSLLLASVRVRSMVLDALGATGLATYGLLGETPRGARVLVSHANTVAKLMQEQPFNMTVEGVTFDSAAMATTLATKAAAVEKALGDMQREEQELANELGNRDVAMASWVEAHQGVADVLVGLFRLAGRKDLSERVRPTSRTLAGEEVALPVEAPKEGGATGA